MSSMNSALADVDRAILLDVARQSIQSGLAYQCPLEVEPADYPESLRLQRATFVTLTIEQRLRGCIGILEARLPLVKDVAEHAFAAAFEDPRFPPLGQAEFSDLELHISVLSPSEPIHFRSEEDLLAQLRPNVDGLILRLGQRRATFLPSVWESLSEPFLFVTQLKQKAGLPLDFWSDELQFERYITESFGDGDTDKAHL
jgi:AmmeMemoRadiSam system protein A